MSLKRYATPPKSSYTTPDNSPSKRLKTPEHKSPANYRLLNQQIGPDGKKIGKIVNVDGDTITERKQNISEHYFPPMNANEWEKKADLKNIGLLQNMQRETITVIKNTDARKALKSHMVGQDPRPKEDELQAYDTQNFEEQEAEGHFFGGKKRRNKKTIRIRRNKKTRKSRKNRKTRRHRKKL